MGSASADAESFVLKIACGEEVHRVRLNRELDFACVQEVLQEVWPGPSKPSAKFENLEGDLCALVEATFADFLASAQRRGTCQLLQVRLLESATQTVDLVAETCEDETPEECQLDSLVTHCSTQPGSCSDHDEQEAIALAEATRLACKQVLANHLTEWLASEPPSLRYESWLSELHPENCDDGVIDARMYHGASTHRQLWNDVAVGAAGSEDEKRGHLFVAAAEKGAGITSAQPPPQGASDHAAGLDPCQDVTSEPSLPKETVSRPALRGQARPAKMRRSSTGKYVGLEGKVGRLEDKIVYRLASWTSMTGLGYIPFF
mmetsp:Transcript_61392/g.155057  ORF Transcript_61392/g.155057 Transcript_61392/m.155057 type:complete len:318 (+) Transcript_61392:50-1003(+)